MLWKYNYIQGILQKVLPIRCQKITEFAWNPHKYWVYFCKIVPGHTTLSSKGKIQYPHYPHIPQQNHTAKPSGTAAQFHSTFRSGNPDTPTSIASHIAVSSYTAALSQCHFRSIIQSIPHTLQHQEISTFRSVTHALVVSQ